MGYGRTITKQELDPQLVQAMFKLHGLEVSAEALSSLTSSLANQLAAKTTLEQFDLSALAPVLQMDASWDD